MVSSEAILDEIKKDYQEAVKDSKPHRTKYLTEKNKHHMVQTTEQ